MSFLRRLPCSTCTFSLLLVIALLWAVGATGLVNLSGWLALVPRAVWGGQLWRPLTAPLLANGLLDVLFNSLALFWISRELERFWKPREWLLYGALCVALAGLVTCAVFPREPVISVNPSLLIVALLVARARLATQGVIAFTPTFSLSARTLALLWVGFILLSALLSGLPLSGFVALAGSAGTGGIYLSLRWTVLKRQAARSEPNDRFSRLEL
jgi:membrane associated rhomboid family serine protease